MLYVVVCVDCNFPPKCWCSSIRRYAPICPGLVIWLHSCATHQTGKRDGNQCPCTQILSFIASLELGDFAKDIGRIIEICCHKKMSNYRAGTETHFLSLKVRGGPPRKNGYPCLPILQYGSWSWSTWSIWTFCKILLIPGWFAGPWDNFGQVPFKWLPSLPGEERP